MSIFARRLGDFRVEIRAGGHLLGRRTDRVWRTDRSEPYDLLLASLASCKIITMQIYAKRKRWSVGDIELNMNTQKIHAKDCEDCESDPEARVDIIETEIKISGNLDQGQRNRLIEISEKCPVHRTLTSETKIRAVLLP